MARERLHRRLFLSYLLVIGLGLVGGAWLGSGGPAWQALLISASISITFGAALTLFSWSRVGRTIDGITETIRALGAARFDGPDVPRLEIEDEIDALSEALGQARRQLSDRIGGLESEAEKLHTVLDGMSEGVALVVEGRIAFANRAFARVLDLSGPIEGRTPLEIIRLSELADAIATAGSGASARARDIVLPSARVLHLRADPLVGGGAVVVLLDVTESRSLERMRREFVANASHELRTPVAAIQAVAETLNDNPNMTPTDRARFERILLAHAGRLARLVSDLLDLSRAESGPPPPLQPVDLRRPVGNAITAVADRAETKRIQLDESVASNLPAIDGDESSLEQVLVNLLDNAIKYTPEGGRVSLRVYRDRALVRIDIADSGPGIAPEHLPRIFERFYRADAARARDQGGTGLGLSIVKHLVQLHRGEVTVASTVGQGSVFRVALPLRANLQNGPDPQ